MAVAVTYILWDSYAGTSEEPRLFASEPLSFNSRQERLHQLVPGDELWLVSRCPADRQYYFVGVLRISKHRRNRPTSTIALKFGEFSVLADPDESRDFGTSFPAEGLLRAFQFSTGRQIRYGGNIGQSLQTLRLLNSRDAKVLAAGREQVAQGLTPSIERPTALWTKCDGVYARYFSRNWQESSVPQAFLLYDPPPTLPRGVPVFIHSDRCLRLVARFLQGQYIAGHKNTVEDDERIEERERIWASYRRDTLDPPSKEDFDKFWEGQNGGRALFLMDEVAEVPRPPEFRVYGRALQWGYPRGVGYRYVDISQSLLLLQIASLPDAVLEQYTTAMLARIVDSG